MSEILPEGVRNSGLISYAGQLRARGLSRDQILLALREANREWCVPPLQDYELRKIAKSAAKWPPQPTCDGHPRQAFVPRGCFDPRKCGFDPAAVVDADTTLRLRRRHKRLYAVLVESFGPYGCHPSQERLAEVLGTFRQQITREVKYLVRAGLITAEAGAYRKAEKKHGATTYHFRRHHLFAAAFARNSSRVLNGIQNISQQFEGEAVQTARKTNTIPSYQRDGEYLATQTVAVEPLSAVGGCAAGMRSLSVEYPGRYYIIRYVECVNGCGGCRIEYSDGTLKRYECSCATPNEMAMAA